MGANPHANGGMLLRDLKMPDFRDYAVAVPSPGAVDGEATRVMGAFLRDVMKLNADAQQFPRLRPGRNRIQPPGPPASRSPTASSPARSCKTDEHLAPDGRVMEVLSEHLCQGWLEGYLLTGRHGFFSCYEAFIHIIDSMFNQHAKWLKVTAAHPLAAAHRLAELPADLARLAAGPQRLQPPGPRLHRSRGEQEGRDHPRLSAAGRQHAALGHRPLPAQPPLHQRHRRRQTTRAAVARHGRRRQALHRRAWASGRGPATTRAANRTWSWPAPATCRPWRRWPPSRCCAATSRN